MVMRSRLHGAQELVARIEGMKNDSEQIITTALVYGATTVQQKAQRKAPKVTRTLSRSIQVGEPETDATRITVKIGTDVEYARRIELGFVGADSLGRMFDQAGKPYMQPALDESRHQMTNKVGQAIRAMIRARSVG